MIRIGYLFLTIFIVEGLRLILRKAEGEKGSSSASVFDKHTASLIFFMMAGGVASAIMDDWLFSVLTGFICISAEQDYRTQEAYDMTFLVPMVPIIMMCFISGNAVSIDSFIPLVFTVLTVRTRGFADTLMMTCVSVYGIYAGAYLTVLLSFTLGYALQLVYQLYGCRKRGIRYKDSGRSLYLPFLPSLYLSYLLVFSITAVWNL